MRWTGWVGLGVVLVVAVVGFWIWKREREPRYGGRTLSEWLYPADPGFVWMPTDLYGHIHDELWAQLIAPSSSVGSSNANSNSPPPPPGAKGADVPRLGPEAIPWLVRWMSERPNAWDHLVTRIGPFLPQPLALWSLRFDDAPWHGRAGRWQIAAQLGFAQLGQEAESAVPRLAPLMERDDADLPLALALLDLGPAGRAVVIQALAGNSNFRRDSAALALGMADLHAAVPALVQCVERGQISYHVLGAIGRIEPRQPAVIAPLIRYLDQAIEASRTQSPPSIPSFTHERAMAVLLLGLQGASASNAIPTLIRWHGLRPAASEGDDADRRLLRRVIGSISPPALRQIPPAGPRDDSDDWP